MGNITLAEAKDVATVVGVVATIVGFVIALFVYVKDSLSIT